jgi:hypothetical protein
MTYYVQSCAIFDDIYTAYLHPDSPGAGYISLRQAPTSFPTLGHTGRSDVQAARTRHFPTIPLSLQNIVDVGGEIRGSFSSAVKIGQLPKS